jgi:hypothetical protein
MFDKILAALGPEVAGRLTGEIEAARLQFTALSEQLKVVDENQRVLYAQGQRIEASNQRIEQCLLRLSSAQSREAA